MATSTTSTTPLPARRRSHLARQEAIAFYLFVAPWIIGFLVFTAGPVVASAYLSLTQYDIANPPVFIGLGNYVALARDPLFWKSLSVTTSYAILALPLGLVASIALALLLNLRLPGLSIWRTIYYLPSVTSGVAVALLWQWIFQPTFGLLNVVLYQVFHVVGPQWLYDSNWVIPAFVIMSLWSVGGSMLIYLGGLQNIPTQLYEAAEIDGAGAWARLWHITLPMLTPVILFNLILGIIGVFSYFTNAYVMTQGGPNYASYFYLLALYQNAFEFLKMGVASAQAWIFFVIVLVLTIITLKSANYWVYYEGKIE
ncbi:MAG TPA: sugar ABC transporter permease [Chloroflexota bacterium]|nr:sugar ABC transporter permease [Chloroflexota bacterium]